MKKPLYILLLAVLSLPVTVYAGELDAQVNAVQRAYRSAEDISADFTQTTYVKLLEKDVIKKGKMYFKKGGKFRIAYAGKNEKTYVSDGDLLWVFIPGDEASSVTYRVDDEIVPKEALKFLSGFDNLKKDFRISPSKVFTQLKPDESALYLKPKSRKAHFLALDAKFNQDNLLKELRIHNKSGNISDYRFTNIKTSTGLPLSLFTHGAGKATPDTLPR